MSVFRFLWLRRFIRRNTSPIPVDRASLWKQRLSIVYMLIAWNAFGFVGYMIYTGKADWAKYYDLKSKEELHTTPGQQWAKTLGIQNATIYRISGFNVTSEDYNSEDKTKQMDNINTKKIN